MKKEEKCKICEKWPAHPDSLCDGCWEVISRLDYFIHTKNGVEYLKNFLERNKV